MKARLYRNTKNEWTLIKPNGAIYKIVADLNTNIHDRSFKSTQVIVTSFQGFAAPDYAGGELLHEIPKFLMHTFFKLMKRKERGTNSIGGTETDPSGSDVLQFS